MSLVPCRHRASKGSTRIGREWILRIRESLTTTEPMQDDERAQTLQRLQHVPYAQDQDDLPLVLPAERAK